MEQMIMNEPVISTESLRMVQDLEDLLVLQIDKLKQCDLEGVKEISERSQGIFTVLTSRKILDMPQMEDKCKRINALYRDVSLNIAIVLKDQQPALARELLLGVLSQEPTHIQAQNLLRVIDQKLQNTPVIPVPTQKQSASDPFCKIPMKSTNSIVDLGALAQISETIPGMVRPDSGQFMYTLCYMQPMQGDVVEIGSWQGRSTSFIARAVKNSGNGKFYAIDHFKGNVGKESFYVVGKEDLSDLKSNFMSNMHRLGLSDTVNLLDMPNDQAVQQLQGTQIRFLFIDGDHTKSGVEKDIKLFFPMLTKGSIVVFDDFTEQCRGVVDAVDEWLSKNEYSKIMSYFRTLVVQI